MEMAAEAGSSELHNSQPQQEEATYSILKYSPGEVPKQYLGFIYSHWLHTARYGNGPYKRIPTRIYYKTYERYISRLLEKSFMRIAVLDADKDVLLGFACYEPCVLHYIYVAREQRNQGIGKRLFPNGLEVYTHYTKCGEDVIKKKLPKLVFNPFM